MIRFVRKFGLLVSVLTIIASVVLVTGSTFSLFTDSDDANIAITSGKVELVATLNSLETLSYKETEVRTDGSFANAGSYANIEGGTVNLVNIVPGDSASVTISFENNSSIAIAYRIMVVIDGELADALDFTFVSGGEDLSFNFGYTQWVAVNEPKGNIDDVVIGIALPENVGNDFMQKSASVRFVVEAIQGNAAVDPYTKVDAHNYVINNVEGMLLFDDLVNVLAPSEANILNFSLADNMDLAGEEWTPVDLHFVNLNGNGYTVSNVNCGTNSVAKSGFIGYMGGATLENITLENVSANGEQAGVVAGLCEGGKFSNVTIKGTNTVAYADVDGYVETYAAVGAIIGADVSGVADKTGITIDADATIAVNYDGLKTEFASLVSDLAFNFAIDVTNNGTVTAEGTPTFIVEGLEVRFDEDGEKYLYLIPEDYAEETVEIPEGITAIGNYAFSYNTNVKTVELPSTVVDLGRGFDSSTVEKVILNEGLTEISSRAFRSTSKLQEVVIPSTVTTIADNAFQKSGIKTITIPASVETIGETAFGASMIETVIFEGDTSIQGYAFRGCTKLRNVYLNGDNTFIASTLNGRNSTWFCNGESNNPNTSNITFYVTSEEVAARVRVAMGAEANNTTIIVVSYAESTEDLVAGLENGGNVILTEDIYATPEITAPYGNKVAFVQNGGVLDGNGHTISVDSMGDNYSIMTSGGTIKNLNIDNGFRGIVLMYANEDVIIDNVTIKGEVCYTINTAEYAVADDVDLIVTNSTICGWTSYAGLASASFTNCVFGQGVYYTNIYGRVLKPYVTSTFTNCEFVEHMNLDLSELTRGSTVTFENCTVNGVAVTLDVFTIPSTNAEYDTDLFTVDLPSWASSISDCVVFN